MKDQQFKIINTKINLKDLNTNHSPEKNTELKEKEKENPIEQEQEQDTTKDNSIINYSMKKNINESHHKKNKGFSSVFNKPIQKNFFFGGDYSDLFNIKDEDSQDTKKFKTVKINKKNKISNKIIDLLELELSDTVSEEESKIKLKLKIFFI
jgi:hypothetical protein